MAEKILNSRIVHKHDTEANWLKATNFTPKQGEIIIYDIDTTYNYERFKIGDGKTVVSSLPFADGELRAELSTVSTKANDAYTVAAMHLVDTKNPHETTAAQVGAPTVAEFNALSALVGDTSVSEQISAANIIYVGPTMPTDPNIKVWINTAEEGTGIVPVLPRITTITLATSAWTGSSAPYSQVVDVNTVTSATKVELNPTVAQIVSMQMEDIALTAENNNGVVTVYSFGGKPSADMTMQVTLTEVSYV